MELRAHITRVAETHASPDAVYALLADVPRSVSHFPDLESLIQENGAWVWRLPRLGAGPLVFQVVYASRYFFEPQTRSVRWEPVPGVGNTQVGGSWKIFVTPKGSRFEMVSDYVVETPFPKLMRGPAEVIMARENERILGQYLNNLVITLNGGDGRVRRV